MPLCACSKRPWRAPTAPCERAADVAKELRFEQCLGNGAAVEGDKAVRAPRTVVVNRPGDHFLSGAGFAGHQNRAARAGHRVEQLKQRLHRPASSKDAAELIALFELGSEVGVLRGKAPLLQRLAQHVQQLIELERFGDKVSGAPFDRIDRVSHRPVAGDDDHDNAGVTGPRSFDDGGAIHTWHAEVGDYDIEGELIEELQCLFAGIGGGHFETVIAKAFGHERPQRRFVIHEEQVWNGGAQGANILTQPAP